MGLPMWKWQVVATEGTVLVSVEGGKAENAKKTPRSRERPNNKFNPHETLSTGIEPGSQNVRYESIFTTPIFTILQWAFFVIVLYGAQLGPLSFLRQISL